MSACFKKKNILQGNLHFTALGQEGIGFGSILQNTGAALYGIQKVCAVIGLLQIIQGVYVIAVHGVAELVVKIMPPVKPFSRSVTAVCMPSLSGI